jgi:hypothetical protein
MQRILASSVLVALSATVLPAQTSAPGIAGTQQSMTLTGCVGRGTTTGPPFTLYNAMPLGPTMVPEPSTVAPPAATSPTVTPSVTTPTGTPSVATGTTGVAGAVGTAGTAGTAGAAGMTGVTPASGAAGTAGVGTPAAGAATGLPPSTYQLSGPWVSLYVGQNVHVTGMLVPSPNVAATAGAQSSGVTRPTGGTDVVGATPPAMPAMPEFRVTRVEPLGIRCP